MNPAQEFEAQSSYAKALAERALPTFTVPEGHLGMGASLGNSALWIHTKGDGAIERVFLNEIGQSLLGTFSIQYGGRAIPPRGEAVRDAGEHSLSIYSGLFAEGPRTFEIHPAYQRVSTKLAGFIELTETTFLPLGGEELHDDQPVVYVLVQMHNTDDAAHRMRVIGSAMLRGTTHPDVRARYDGGSRALVAQNAGSPQWVRVLALSQTPTKYGTDFDYGGTYDASYVHALGNDTSITGDVIGRLQLDLVLRPRERREFWFTLALYATGEEEALRRFARVPAAPEALSETVAHLEEVLSTSRVLTPDPLINHGALWSKVNMRRVMAAYPNGVAFTNDPGKYANVVIRDCAWFVYGNDHFMQSFSRRLLDGLAQRQYENGKLPEYFDAVSGRVEDDGLNINDDTPLYILAVNHHFRATGDPQWLAATYPVVAKAARYIISQIDERGLVFCSANDPRGDVWAIAGWRNIIDGYSINGAVTEINSECVAALRAAGHLADNLGGHEADREEFAKASDRIREAMNKHLINPKNGLYYLNIDVDGFAHTDVTGDEIFPVVMRACSEETGFRIISRLNSPDFWTSAGLRTVSRRDPRFDPAAHSGLMGGVWPGLTWWYAFAAARYHPEFMVHALRSSFGHYGADPRRYNTVPGQFSEWFDGESLSNRGMRLSPWEPPRFLWAAVEGVCGLMLSPGAPRISPLIPRQWSWVGLRNIPYHGSSFSYFCVREGEQGYRIRATADVDSDTDVMLYRHDVSDEVRVYADSANVIAFARDDGLTILVGNTCASTVHAPISIQNAALIPKHAVLRVYNSERGGWEDCGSVKWGDLRGMALTIESGGFRLLELSSVSP
jgi:hypothetical protein